MLRILLKILLSPITLILTILLLMCEFVCIFGFGLLSILASIAFVIAVGSMIFSGEKKEGLKILLLAYLISPYGIPMLAAWLIGILKAFNERLKSI